MKICIVCGNEFEPNNGVQKCCSEKCVKEKDKNYNKEYYSERSERIKIKQKKICKVENCERSSLSENSGGMKFCKRHYNQFWTYGKILKRTKFDPNEFVDCGDYFEIVLFNNKNEEVARALIDKEDYEEAKKYKWRVDRYVKTRVNKKHFLLHYLVLERKKGLEIDHINHNIFDNRRQNLRYVTKSQNQWNQKSKGYSWDKNKLKWRVSLKVNYKTIHLGYYKDEKDAQIARLNGEKKYFREYAYKLK